MQNTKIIAIGNELLRGDILDTNTAWLATSLNHIGFSLAGASLALDNVDEICRELEFASKSSDLVICTGGLGPTADDLTRDALAKFLNVDLELSQESLSRLEAQAKRRGRELYETGRRQAYFPKGAEIFVNTLGTADAFLVKKGKCLVVCLPGVPREMKLFYERDLKPWLVKNYPEVKKVYHKHLRIFGISESYIGKCVEECRLPKSIEVSYRASFPEVKLSFFSKVESEVIQAEKAVSEKMGEEFIFSREENEHLASVVFNLLLREKKTLSLAESCSGGKLADQIISIPGSSKVLLASVVSYSNEAKKEFLLVSEETIREQGAVSAEVALEMAEGIRERTGSDYAISVTGIAGPDGGSEEKPVGSVWIGLATTEVSEAHYFCYSTERNAFRTYVSTLALDLLRRLILNYPLTWETK